MTLIEWMALAASLLWGGLSYLQMQIAAAERDEAAGALAKLRGDLAALLRSLEEEPELPRVSPETAAYWDRVARRLRGCDETKEATWCP